MKKKAAAAAPQSIIKLILIGTLGITITLGIVILVLPAPRFKIGLATLHDAQEYSKQNPEVQPESANTIKPEYTKYLATQKPSWGSFFGGKFFGFLYRIGLSKAPLWSTEFFIHQIHDVAQTRESKGFKGDVIVKVSPAPQSKIVLFGNVQAAYQSLVRCLTKLKELSIINDDFKLTTPDHAIIFTGDIVSRAPFSMQTISLVCRLLQQNPDNVVWIRGNHETNNYWQEHALKAELQARAAHLAKGTVPLTDEVNRLFNTLPLATYIATRAEGGKEVIRISDAGRTQSEVLKEEKFAQFLTSKSDARISMHSVATDQKGKPEDVDVRVIFKGEKKRDSYQPHDGMRLLPPDMGSVSWTTLSCPTPLYQKALKYKHDAFVVITPAAKLDEWKATLYNRDVTTQNPFSAKVFMLLSGVEEGKAPSSQVPQAQAQPAAQPTAGPAAAPVQPAPTAPQVVAAQTQTPAAVPTPPAVTAAPNQAASQQAPAALAPTTSAFGQPAQLQPVTQPSAVPTPTQAQQSAPQAAAQSAFSTQQAPQVPQSQQAAVAAAPQSQPSVEKIAAPAAVESALTAPQAPPSTPSSAPTDTKADTKETKAKQKLPTELAEQAAILSKEAQDLAEAAQKFAEKLQEKKETN